MEENSSLCMVTSTSINEVLHVTLLTMLLSSHNTALVHSQLLGAANLATVMEEDLGPRMASGTVNVTLISMTLHAMPNEKTGSSAR